ncbi:hypothetical protein JL720_13707 [Aureococcus anophagefferens]|nr:hypothetical protein JL720_13707 [Aureococcus anophagefferens]
MASAYAAIPDDGARPSRRTVAARAVAAGVAVAATIYVATDSCRIYKRTFASKNAVVDAEVVYRALGLDYLDNLTYTRHGGAQTCAHRELLQTNGQEPFGLHFFTSEVTDYGELSPGDFAAAATASIEAEFSATGGWSQWAVPAVTFYAASLDPFLSAWEAYDDMTYKLSYYVSPLDGSTQGSTRERNSQLQRLISRPFSTRYTLYNVFLLLPMSGTTLRVVAPHAGRFQPSAEAMTTNMCASSLFVNQTVMAMKAHLIAVEKRRLAARDGRRSGASDAAVGYPDLLVVELANPMDNIEDVPSFIQEFAQAGVSYETLAKADNGANCSWTAFDMDKCGLATDGDQCSEDDGFAVSIKAIANGGASHGLYSPGASRHARRGVHQALTGCNTGWDRYLDSHLGVWCTKPRYLDNIAPKLCRNDMWHPLSGRAAAAVRMESEKPAPRAADAPLNADDDDAQRSTDAPLGAPHVAPGPLSADDLAQFVRDGYCLLPGAFPRDVAFDCRDALWRRVGDLGIAADDPATWSLAPKGRLGLQDVFRESDLGAPWAECWSDRLRAALDQLCGAGRWVDDDALGCGWVDSREIGVLPIFLFSDVAARGGGTALAPGRTAPR